MLSHSRLPVIVLLAGLLLTATGTYFAMESVDARQAARAAKDRRMFEQDAAEIQSNIESRIDAYIALLRGAKALFVINPDVNRADFRRFVERLEVSTRYPGIQGIGFTRRLMPAERDAFISKTRQELPSFDIWPKHERDEYHTIVMLEPLDRRNEAALGYDMFTQPTRRAAMEKARDIGAPALSGAVTLVQEIDEKKQPGFLIYLPIYRQGATPATVEQRRELLAGFAYSPFRAMDFIEGIGMSPRLQEIDFQLEDAGPQNIVLRPFRTGDTSPDMFTHEASFEVAGYPWKLKSRRKPPLTVPVSRAIIPTTALAGILITGLMFVITLRQTREKLRTERQREWLRVTLSSIGDAVIACDTAGLITFMNTVAENLTGWKFHDAEGKAVESIIQIFNEQTREPIEAPIRRVLREGQMGAAANPVLIAANGREIPIEDSASPIRDANGKIVGAVMVFQNVEEKRRAERAVRERAQIIAAQHAIGTALSRELDTQKLVQLITDEALKVCRAEFGAFFYNVLNEKGESYMLYTLSGAPREEFSKFEMPRATALFAPTFKGEGVIRSDDITKDPRYGKSAPYYGMPPGHLAVKSYLAVPVKTRTGEVLGALFFGHSQVGVFSDREEQIVTGIAAQASIALDNAKLFEAAQREVEARRKTEKALRESEHRFKRLYDSNMIGVAFWNTDGLITEANDEYLRIAGVPRAEFEQEKSLDWRKLTPPEYTHLDDRAIEQVRRSGASDAYEKEYLRRDGSRIHIVLGVALFADSPREGVAFVLDNSAAKKSEAERLELLKREQQARSAAEAASKAKDEFIAVVSHELRTPLTPMLGWIKMIKQTGFDQKTMMRGVDVIERNVMAQIQLVEDLLDINRIITGKMKLDIRHINLKNVVETAVEVVRVSAQAKQIDVSLEAEDAETCTAYGDFTRLQQVMTNLLANAVKFTPLKGKVKVTLQKTLDYVEICVSDTGEGVEAEYIPHMFKRFSQADSSTTRTHGGLGLGLAIVRHIVELHDGKVWAESEGRGCGARFYVRLPSATVPIVTGDGTSSKKGQPQVAGIPKLENARILVVDDVEDTREFLRVLLGQWGAKVESAATVSEALEIYARFEPDVIVSDIGMPGEDGYVLMRKLKEKYGASKAPAIAMTAYARIEDRMRAIEEGFELHLPKPVEPLDLAAAITRVLLLKTV
ncbi:MAG TPA: CHASE domain-containing protein [Planctomycetota bacterium]|nr:CHASE domain-containing protein [Planctomycetota bacterium]